MGNKIKRLFDDRTVGFKFTVLFMLVILIPMTLLAYTSYKVIDANLRDKAREKISMGIKAAMTEYYVRGEQMRYGMLQAASTRSLKEAVVRGDKEFLKDMMLRWKQGRDYVDIWTVVDSEGKVIARINSNESGDELALSGLVQKALSSGEAVISSEVFSEDLLKKEDMEPAGPASASASVRARYMDGSVNGAMALTVVTPVFDDNGKPKGAIITADIINRDSFIPEGVASKIPGLFTSISMNGVRISTNLIDDSGRSMISTELPDDAFKAVSAGKAVFAEWNIPGMTLLSTFEPIKDHTGRVIGSIDSGISKSSLWMIQRKNQQVIALMTLIGLSVSLIAAGFSAQRITRPIKTLKEKIRDFADGDMGARIELADRARTKDEVEILSRTFNQMMDEVNIRDLEKGAYLAEIESKNRAFLALNEELKTKNEELEVAYEETQSQTEELHAINEELKLLNEDLDRKNTELEKANRTITEEEEALKKARDKLHMIYDSIKDYVLVVDYGHNILEANRHFLDEFKISLKEALGRRLYAFFGLIDKHQECPLQEALDKMTPVTRELVLADGKALMVHAYPLIEEQENGKKAVLYIKDVTEERLLMQKLIHSDKLASLGELVSGVAHELNNPLTGIMCFSELLIEDCDDKGVISKLEKVRDASVRCKKIIENLLTFARVHRPEKKLADVNDVIRECVELREYQMGIDNIELKLDLSPNIPKTMLDANQLLQVFVNLVNNARDAIVEAGDGGDVMIRSFIKDNKIMVEFEDTGTGIQEDVIQRIFDPFITTKEVGMGTGLGLSISYGIIKEHGGDIYAYSNKDGGAVFTIELPVVVNPRLTSTEYDMSTIKKEEIETLASGRAALVLDDEPIVLDILDGSLSALGMNVDRAQGVSEAIEKISRNYFDVIISDIKMPGLDGKDFYRDVRKIHPEVLDKIIFITGDRVNADTVKFLEETGNLSLKKPFTVEELGRVLVVLLSGKIAKK